MIPMHLSSNIPSTSATNNASTRLRGTVSGGTVRYMYGIPVVGTVPVRIKIRRPLPQEEIYGGGLTFGPRTIIERKFNSRPATVAARRKKLPTRTSIFDISQHTPARNEPTYEDSQFNPAQIDTVSLSARRNSNIRASQGNLSNIGGPVVLYEQQHHPMIQTYGTAAPYDPIPPMWYPAPPPPIPVYFCAPPPLDSKTMRKAMEHAIKAEKRYKAKKDQSECSQFCCGGIAKLLWVLIAFILVGCIAMVVMSTMLL